MEHCFARDGWDDFDLGRCVPVVQAAVATALLAIFVADGDLFLGLYADVYVVAKVELELPGVSKLFDICMLTFRLPF